jgi:hypothetical protein
MVIAVFEQVKTDPVSLKFWKSFLQVFTEAIVLVVAVVRVDPEYDLASVTFNDKAVMQLSGVAAEFKALAPTFPVPQLKHEVHSLATVAEHPIQ